MARQIIDTTIGAGDTIKAGGDKINAMTGEVYPGAYLAASAAGLTRAQKIVTWGTSHCTGSSGMGVTVRDSLWRLRDCDVIWDHRGVFTNNSVTNPVLLSPRGASYATGSATSEHVVNVQLPQFITDTTTGGMRFEIGIGDFGAANDSPGNQAALDLIMSRADQVLAAFFDPNGNNGLAFAVWGLFTGNPSICNSWASMWRAKERASNGRIRFLDVASRVIDRAAATGTNWAWRGGSPGAFGSPTDGGAIHLSEYGSRLVSPLIDEFLSDVVPRKFNRGGAYASTTYDPVNKRWANMLGSRGAMLGTGGAVSGGATGTVPDGWIVVKGGTNLTVDSLVGVGADGEREWSLSLGGTAAAGDVIFVQTTVPVANVNAGVASRKHMMGIEVEFVGVAGVTTFWLSPMANNNLSTPISSQGGQADGMPVLNEVWKPRSLYPVGWAGDNPIYRGFIQFRAGNPAGTIKLRRAWLELVEEGA